MRLTRKFASDVSVRFAPSPTGRLHFGGARTALYNYLFARKNGGRFLVRIEDTDRQRSTAAAARELLTTLSWLGIRWDGRPVVQSTRLELYHEAAEGLVQRGLAYRCFCAVERLSLLRREALKLRRPVGYDNHCRRLDPAEAEDRRNSGEASVVRLKLPDQWSMTLQDLVYGNHEAQASGGDPVLLKSDGYPTYHFASVVDDHHMQISHVLRGEEWLTSTPIHLYLYECFGWTPPTFGHLPVMLNLQGGKLSKRDGAAFIEEYKARMYYPEAIVNFVCFAGGGFGTDKDRSHVYSMDELQRMFDIHTINRRRTKLDFQWLNALNRQVLEKRPESQCLEDLRSLITANIAPDELSSVSDDYARAVLRHHRKELPVSLCELVDEHHRFLWTKGQGWPRAQLEPDDVQRLANGLDALLTILAGLQASDFVRDSLGVVLAEAAAKCPPASVFLRSLRRLVTGSARGLPLAELFEMFGKDECLQRLRRVRAELTEGK